MESSHRSQQDGERQPGRAAAGSSSSSPPHRSNSPPSRQHELLRHDEIFTSRGVEVMIDPDDL
jgi:hypothetical protein